MREGWRLFGLASVLTACAVAGCGGSGSSAASHSQASGSTTGSPTTATTSSRTSRAATTHRNGQHAAATVTTPQRLTKNAPARGKSSQKPVAPGGPNSGTTTTYAGSGSRVLSEIKLAHDAVLHWTDSGGQFSLVDASRKLNITGHGTSGQGFAAAGSYAQVHVTAVGQWKLLIQLLNTP